MPKAKKEKSPKATKPLGAVKTKGKGVTLEVSVNDLEYKAKAVDLHQALLDLVTSPEFPFAIKTRAFVKFSNGKVERSVTYPTAVARRVFRLVSTDPTSLELLAVKLTEDLI